ncbi:Insulin-degrading enzyme, partial [Temnothorax longispinosus]
MKILLISDSKTDISIAAINVNIGSKHDPDDLPGLAHLCEHMLHMGTEEYPQQNNFAEYVSQSGGRINADTHFKFTSYYFNIIPKKLKGALDRFAQFFIAPFFRKDLIEKEINNIHSEYNERLTDDEWRFEQALVKLSIKPDHPYSKLNIGNKKTLNETPKKDNIDVKDRLKKFYEKYYSANIMSLCILSKDGLNNLKNMVIKRFRNVKNKELPVYSGCPFKDDDFNTVWLHVPIGYIRKLDVTFAFSEKREDQMSLKYIKHLLRHKSEGSLLSALKAKSLCNNIEAGDYPVDTNIHFFKVKFHLTKKGLEDSTDIVEIMFQYINMLKKNEPKKLIYDVIKIQQMSDINNRYNEKIHCLSVDDISKITCCMQECPMKEIFSKQRAWQSYLIKDLIKEYFTPQNIRIYIATKACESETDEREEWYNIKYFKGKIPEGHMKSFNRAADAADSSTELKLPLKNTFIPMKFDIKNETNKII